MFKEKEVFGSFGEALEWRGASTLNKDEIPPLS